MNDETMAVYRMVYGATTELIYIGRASHQQIMGGILHNHYAHLSHTRIMGVYPDGRINIYQNTHDATLMCFGNEVKRLENGDYDFVSAVQAKIDPDHAGFILCKISNSRCCVRIYHSMTPKEITSCNDVANLLFKKSPDLVDPYTIDVLTGERNAGGLNYIDKIELIAQV